MEFIPQLFLVIFLLLSAMTFFVPRAKREKLYMAAFIA